MASNYQERIIFGMKEIHVAIYNETEKTYATPVPILGAKSIECSFSAEQTDISADDKVVYTASSIATGEGSLEVLGLTGEEKRLIFGGSNTTGYALTNELNQPTMALMFSQQKADGKICRIR